MIIDPPSVFDSLSEWTRFRRDMEALDQAIPEVREWLNRAKEMEAELSTK